QQQHLHIKVTRSLADSLIRSLTHFPICLARHKQRSNRATPLTMKITIIASLLAAALSSVASAASSMSKVSAIAHVHKHPEHHQRFLQDLDELKAELEAWKKSESHEAAKQLGVYAGQDGDFESDGPSEDAARLYLTKQSIAEAQQRNPDAVFSLKSPFTLLLQEEFNEYVARGFGSANTAADAAVVLDDNTDSHNTTTPVAAPVHNVSRELSSGDSVDWSTSKCVAPPQQQGNCGCCWAFAAVASLESANCIKTGKFTKLSEQELTTCAIDDGCGGSFPHVGLNFVKEQSGLSSSAAYPYTNGAYKVAQQCEADASDRVDLDFDVVKVSNAVTSRADIGKDPSYLRDALKQQPVAIGVTAGNPDFKQYNGGVLRECGSTALDHAVFAVGYSVTSRGSTVFKVRNSWGGSWGERGYFRVQSSACRITDYGYYPSMSTTGACFAGAARSADHAVFAVGYSVTSRGSTVFKVRNWWGESWGEQGYFRVQSSACQSSTMATTQNWFS
ncbi:TPA: hypothetical protein N0F65_009838, partial [Lagenidium giganteum]